MKQPHAHLFADIAWSTGEVAAATRARAAALGLEVVVLPTWYDVDDAASLARLLAEAGGDMPSPGTCSRTPRRPPGSASHASGCADASASPRNDRSWRRMALLAAIGAALVVLVAAGLAVLDRRRARSG